MLMSKERYPCYTLPSLLFNAYWQNLLDLILISCMHAPLKSYKDTLKEQSLTLTEQSFTQIEQ